MAIKFFAGLAAFALTLSVSPAFAADEPAQNAPSPAKTDKAGAGYLPIPDEFKAQVERSTRIGRVLYLLDKVAAQATDVFHANVSEADRSNIGGYLTLGKAGGGDQSGSSYYVIFYTKESPARVAYAVTLAEGKEPAIVAVDPLGVPEPGIAALIRARETALKAAAPFSQPMNPVVLPGEAFGEEGVIVYLLAGTKQAHTVVMGKHYRVVVQSDGNSAKSVMPLSKGIFEQSTLASNGSKPEALAVTNLVADYPLETHVLNSLQSGIPLAVVTEHGVWMVAGDKIRLLQSR